MIWQGLYWIECFDEHVITTMLDHATHGRSFVMATMALQIQCFSLITLSFTK